MPSYTSKLTPESKTYQENLELMKKIIEDYEFKISETKKEGSDSYIKRHKEQGKLLARERIEQLIDPGSPFIELMPLAGLGQEDMTPGGSVVGGIGLVHGKPCVINANVPTIKGGALNYIGVLKGQRLDQIAKENKLPCIYLVESAGAHLPQQAMIYNQGGVTFREISRRSAMGLINIAVVFGPSTAGGAYIPGMSDYIIMVKNQGRMYLAGPPLVKMAINEDSDEEGLGGAQMHAHVSGTADYLAKDETSALIQARDILKHHSTPTLTKSNGPRPKHDPSELLGVMGTNLNKPLDMREVLLRLTDDSEFSLFKENYGPTLLCAYANIEGRSVGIIANQGVLVPEAAQKGTQFIQLCNQEGRPLIFLQNITGFMVGKKVEQQGIIKYGAQMINAVSNSEVPAITIIIGASYGAGNYAMCGRAFAPRFLFSWPQSKMAVMGAEQLAGVLETIKRDAAARSSTPIDEQELKKTKEALRHQIEHESTAYYATSRLWDDGIIDPRDTRKVLANCLDLIDYSKRPLSPSRYAVFRM